jgi:hypothetical protein
VAKQIFCQTFSKFWAILKAPADKLVPHYQISFKSRLHNAESK